MPWKGVEGLGLLRREESSTGLAPMCFGVKRDAARPGLAVAPCELQRGPIAVDGADLIVDQTSGDGTVAYMVLVEVDVLFAGAFGVDDPYGGLFGKAEGEEVEGGCEVLQRADEAERQVGLWTEARGETDVVRQVAEEFFKAVGRGDESNLHIAGDA
jgi:hypothetical protein